MAHMLSKAESEAGDGAASVAEILAAKFSWYSLISEYRKTWLVFGDREEDCWPHYSG